MLSRSLDCECAKCHGTGRIAVKKTSLRIACDCPAGRALARPIGHVAVIDLATGRIIGG